MSTITDTLAGNSIYAPRQAEFAYAETDRSTQSDAQANALPGRPRFRVLRVIGLTLAATLIFVGSSVAGGFLSGLVGGFATSMQWLVTPETLMLIFQVGFYASLAAVAFWRPRGLRSDQWWSKMGWGPTKVGLRLIGQVLGIQLLCLVWAAVTTVLAAQHGTPGKPNVGSVSLILAFVLLAPVVEEIFFRGWLQARAARLLPAWGATALTSVLFALAHYNGSFVKPLAILALGVGTGWLRQRSGSLIPGTLLHILNNGLVAILIRLS